MILSSAEIGQELTALGFGEVGPPSDDNAFCPALAWARLYLDWLTPQIRAVLFKLQGQATLAGGQGPQQQIFDCDNVARRVADRASDFLVENNSVPPNCDHAIYPCVLAISAFGPGLNGIKQGEHATNIIRTSDAGWVFAEGCTGLLCDASEALASGAVARLRFVRRGL